MMIFVVLSATPMGLKRKCRYSKDNGATCNVDQTDCPKLV